MGIRGRLLLGYIAVIVILIASGAIIVQRLSHEIRTNVENEAVTVAALLMAEVDQAMQARVQSVTEFVGTSSVLQSALAASNAEFQDLGTEAQIQAAIEERDAAWTFTAPTPFMQGILENRTSAYLRGRMAFHEGVDGNAVFGEIFVTNRYGANVAQTGLTSDYMQKGEDWWDGAWEDRLWIAPRVKFDESARQFSIEIAVRVDDLEGAPLGVLKAVLDVHVLWRIVDDFESRSRLRGAFVELLDFNGVVIHRQGDPDAFRTDLAKERAVALARSGHRDAIVEQTERGELLRAFVRSRGTRPSETFGWVLILNQPTARAYAPVREAQRWVYGVGIIGSLLAVVVGVFLSRAFARVTNRLEETSASLRQSEAGVRSIVSHVVDGIVTILPDGEIESVNPAFLQIFGYTEEELVGRNIDLLLPEPREAALDRSIRSSLVSREGVGLRKDGRVFPFDLAVGEIVDSKTPRFVAVVRDATDRHEARHAMQEAKEAAEAASRSKGEFLANMSHELRTPLNAIIGYTEMVAEELAERQEPDLVADLDRVRTSARNLLGLINDILDVSKIEAGRVEVFRETFEFGSFLRGVVSTVQPLIEANGNEIEVDVAAGFEEIHTDETKLRQILLNLLSNAAKFTRDGHISLRARGDARDGDDWLEITVGDTGIGMTAEHLEHVWDAFTQADASTTREFGGTGLGLTITRSFCELLGGEIAVSSEHGAGTTFTVRLPRVAPTPSP